MNPILLQRGNLAVTVDPNPIGGYRGRVGTLMIQHVKQLGL